MRAIGFVTVAVVGVVAIGGIGIAMVSIPDVKRYLRIRSM